MLFLILQNSLVFYYSYNIHDLSCSSAEAKSVFLICILESWLQVTNYLGFSFSHRIQEILSFTAKMFIRFWSPVKRCSRLLQMWELLVIQKHQWAVTPRPMEPYINLHCSVFQYQNPPNNRSSEYGNVLTRWSTAHLISPLTEPVTASERKI